MDPKYKTLIPLIIIFFIFGMAVGYFVHKPQTITETVTVTVTVTPTPTTPATPTPTATPTPAATQTPAVTPTGIGFTVKEGDYDPAKDIPTHTIQFINWKADPSTLSIRQGDSVLIKIADSSLTSSLTLILNSSYEKNLGVSGVAFVTFNKKGLYTFKGELRSDTPGIKPNTFAEGTISVY